jgi:hypothetical protein
MSGRHLRMTITLWFKRLFCRHEWRKPLRLVALGTGEPLTEAKLICRKCGKTVR